MEPQATKTETNELEGAKTLRQAAGDCRVALADLIGFFTLKLLSLIRSFVVMKISSDTTWIKHSKVLFKKLNRFPPKNPIFFSRLARRCFTSPLWTLFDLQTSTMISRTTTSEILSLLKHCTKKVASIHFHLFHYLQFLNMQWNWERQYLSDRGLAGPEKFQGRWCWRSWKGKVSDDGANTNQHWEWGGAEGDGEGGPR